MHGHRSGDERGEHAVELGIAPQRMAFKNRGKKVVLSALQFVVSQVIARTACGVGRGNP